MVLGSFEQDFTDLFNLISQVAYQLTTRTPCSHPQNSLVSTFLQILQKPHKTSNLI